MNGLKVKDSKIEGKGLFADQEFNEGDLLGIAHINGNPTGMIGRFHNHSDNPNAHSITIGNKKYLAALRPLMKGEEITVDYRRQPDLEQPEQFQNGGSSGDKFKKRLMKRNPGMQGVYGPEGENLNIIKDPNYRASDYGYGDIEFIHPGDGTVNYSEEYQYQSPTPDKYTAVYNPKGANKGDVFLDMMHGMRNDPNYEPLLQNFDKAVRDARGGDMEYFYNQDTKEGYTDGQEQWDENYVDGQLRAQLAPGTLGMFSQGRKDYRMERKYDSPEMKAAAKDIRNYLKGEYEKGGEPKNRKLKLRKGDYDPQNEAGYIQETPDVNVADPTIWGKYGRKYEENVSEEDFVNRKKKQYLALHPGLTKKEGLTMDYFPANVEQNFRDAYDYNKHTAMVKGVSKEEGWNPKKRDTYVDDLNTQGTRIISDSKYGSKLQPNTWSRSLAGLQELGNTVLPGQPFKYNIPGLTKAEQKQMREDPISALEIFAPANTLGQNIANAVKNRGLSYGSDYKELPDFASGEFMPNVTDADAMALDPIQMALSIYSAAQLPGLVSKSVKSANKLMNTKDGLLSNAYKINPWAGELGTYNRVVGKDAITDLQNSGLVRAGDYGGVNTGLAKRVTPYPSFGKGAPRQAYIDQTIQQGKTPFIVSTDRSMKASNLGRHGKGSTMFPVDETGNYMSAFSADDVKVFDVKPHWLKGYKEVPKQLPGSPNSSLELGKASKTIYPQPITNSVGLKQFGQTTYSGPVSVNRTFKGDIDSIKNVRNPEGIPEEQIPYLLDREELMRRYPRDYMSKDELIGYNFKSGLKPTEYPTEIPANFTTQEDILARILGKPLPSRAKPKVYYDIEGNPISEEEAIRILNTREYVYGGFVNRSKLNRFIR